MLLLMMTLSLISSVYLIFFKHPLSMGFTLLIQTILVSMTTGFFNYNYWFSYILFLIMVGGMLILFLYMTSVASNEKFKFNNKIFIFSIIIMMMSLIINLKMEKLNFNLNNFYNENYICMTQFNYSMTKYFNTPNYLISFLLIIYLLITLIAVVKITNINKGPLRQN